MTKKERLNLIVKIIEENEIETQEELTAKLCETGCDVSQATVSRDIKQLNLIKISGVTKNMRYVSGGTELKKIPQKYLELYRQVCVSVMSANNLIVIKTLSGNAGAAGMAIDAMKIPQIIGTIAGDDTLLVIAKNNSEAEIIMKKLRNI